MQNILRFYYSCKHIKDTIITEERMNELCKESITIEEDNKVVHIHPLICCRCSKCLNEEIIEFGLWIKQIVPCH